jgi:osmoprotectant transport system permease protein
VASRVGGVVSATTATLPQTVNNSTWHQITTWFSTGSSWTGSQGALHLLVQHLWISGVSLGLACVIGIPLSIALARWERGGVFVTSLANATRAIPIVGVMVLLAVGPLGLGTRSAIIPLVIFAIPPLLTNTFTGIRNVDRELTQAAYGMGMTRGQVSRRVELPLAIPLIATGVRLAAVQVWATATIAAIIGSGGLGQLVTVGYATQNYGEVYGGVVVVIVTALILDATLAQVQSVVRRKYGDNDSGLEIERATAEAVPVLAAH